MRLHLLTAVALSFACSLAASETDESAESKAEQEARVKANLAQHAERRATKDAAKDESRPEAEPAAETAPSDEADGEPTMLLPEFRVSSSRISELDIEIKKLNKEIERAKKKLKPSELDESLNSDDAPKILSILGGKTASQRKSIAAERVHMMETERDILEAMKHVRTKKEEAELKEQLNTFKTMRRQLDEELR